MAKTILIVDRDFDYTNELRHQLESQGMNVLIAGQMNEAIEMCSKQRPDIAISEISLEYPDAGFTFCYLLKKKDPSIPILLVSDVSVRTGMTFNVSTAEERSWIKADVFLDKPVPFETIHKEIQRLLA